MKVHKRRAHLGRAALAAIVLCGSIGPAAIAAPEDVKPQRFLLGKTVNYRQSADGDLTLLNYHFFAEISVPSGLQGGTARLIDPDGRVVFFQRSGKILSIPGKRDLMTLAELNAYAPNGLYTVQFDAPWTRTVKGAIQLDATEEAMADPVRITLVQDGQPISPNAVEVGKPLTVSWSPSRKGRPSRAGIADDTIFVHIGDCRGNIIARSPSSSADKPALRYSSQSYTIAANILNPGTTYQVDVEDAPVQVTPPQGDVPAGLAAVARATYPATTYLDFHTRGTGSNTCPEKPYRMDNGQSDRPRAPLATATTQSAPGAGEGVGAAIPSVTDQVTFLYYDDLTAPRRFYSESLGLVPYLEGERASFYHSTPGATIGLVKVPRNAAMGAAKRSVVMVSIVTDDVAGWYKKLKQDPKIHIAKDLYDHPRVSIRAFEVEDPGGYPIEFFQYLPERR